ncbi:hypothetical protein [Spartinivicinus poritis]|uniref:Uncharacterized protein n=1 Tax=Spartinivicinus poritis TaxID=2994640 RepID=A0ABT5UCN9_9GAMM|nr:hypothetical protein [Spartinivicinus sp. A2-2]MDE1464137.1 hypothetical protein [Spartinivicinus sp. A2-2]
MNDPREQLERVKRSLDRVKNNKNKSVADYRGDLYHFFQDCYHLKDWIKNYSTINGY